eukprot:gb/GECG01007176.1/.p1 GENE.gb/GECG01007176.1/~~gb/GECG01007176.1/.p1  ORF type:complete len:169 (+),score=13.46 gb/GECG01007176.1/:1-507(+)
MDREIHHALRGTDAVDATFRKLPFHTRIRENKFRIFSEYAHGEQTFYSLPSDSAPFSLLGVLGVINDSLGASPDLTCRIEASQQDGFQFLAKEELFATNHAFPKIHCPSRRVFLFAREMILLAVTTKPLSTNCDLDSGIPSVTNPVYSIFLMRSFFKRRVLFPVSGPT